MVVLVESGN